MSDTSLLLRSFAGGEITPEMVGRLDLVKYQTGLALCRNFVTLPHGPAHNRSGFEYIAECLPPAIAQNAVRLIPFVFSAEQSYVLEFGPGYIAFITGGAAVLEAPKSVVSISQASPGVVEITAHGFADGERVYAAGIGGMTALNGRFYLVDNATTDTFTLQDLDGTPISTVALPAYTSGGTVSRQYSIASPYAAGDLMALHYVQSNDVLTITHPGYPPTEIRRLGPANWTCTPIAFTPTISPPASAALSSAGPGGGNPQLHRYRVTSVAANGAESVAAAVGVSAPVSISGVTAADPGAVTATAHGRQVDDRVYASGIPDVIPTGEYFVNTVPDANTVTLKSIEGVPVDTTGTTYVSGGTLSLAAIEHDLTVPGNVIRIDWPAAPDALQYRVYKTSNNGVFGYIGAIDAGPLSLYFEDRNITPDTSRSPPIANDPFTGADNYPRALGYFEQRRVFGGTNNQRQTVWLTRSAREADLTYSSPTRDDDSIIFSYASRQLDTVEHVVPLDDLWLLTSGAEYRVVSQNSDALTPFTMSVRARSYIGCTSVQPIVAQDSCLFGSRGGHLREISYRADPRGSVADASIFATHLFDGLEIVDLAYAQAPVPVVWAVSSDGRLLGMTYVVEHQVLGWHQHDTALGVFRSCCVVREGTEDVIYVATRRNVQPRGWRLFIERMRTRAVEQAADGFFVDCGLTYAGTPATTITGLHHLGEATVSVLADGAVHPPRTISGGAITLEQPASKVHVGLPIVAQLRTLPLQVEIDAVGQGRQKNVSQVHLSLLRSSGVFVGPSFSELTEMRQRTTEPYGSPPRLVTGLFPVVTRSQWSPEGAVCVQQTHPLPVTVRAMAVEVAIGG